MRSAQLFWSDGQTASLCAVLDVAVERGVTRARLPDLVGFELSARLADSGIKGPVIFIAAYDEAATRDESTKTNAAGYFPKPFDGRNLIAAITHAIEMKHDDRCPKDGRFDIDTLSNLTAFN